MSAKDQKQASTKDQKQQLTATYDQDSRRFHRFLIDENGLGIVGNIYISKNQEIPKEITITIRTKADATAKKEA